MWARERMVCKSLILDIPPGLDNTSFMGASTTTFIAILGMIVVFLIVVLAAVFKSRSGGEKKNRKKKDRETIIKEANRLLAQNPKDHRALTSLADLYFSEQAWEKAMKTYGVLMNLCATVSEIDEFEVTLRYGLCAMQLKSYDEAHKALVLARNQKVDVFEINYNLGYLEYRRKNYEKAASLLKLARDERPDHIPSQRYLGQTYYKLKKYKESIELLKKVVDLEPDDKESLFTMGKAYYELAQYEMAVRIFTHLRPDPQIGPSAALLAGTIRLKNRESQQAIMDFEIGLRHTTIAPDVKLELKYRLAAAYTAEQELAKAVPLLQEIYKTNPGYKDVAAQLSRSRELNSNRNLQTFLMAPSSEFVGLCRRVVTGFVPQSQVKIVDINVRKSEYADILAEIETAKWMDTILFRFVRTTGQVGELLLRDMHSRIKDLRAGRGYCFTAGNYSEEARHFVEARLIDLIAKDKLVKVLQHTS